MYYRLSNSADKGFLEAKLGKSFRDTEMYSPELLLNGLEQVRLPLVIMEDKDHINLATWGILPEHYQDDWSIFQNIFNTLNLSKESLESDLWLSKALESRRCLVIATGFFTTYLHKGEVYPYYVYCRDNSPMCIGGIYNRLDDGSLTTALIIVDSSPYIKQIQNVERGMPLLLREESKSNWLNEDCPAEKILQMIRNPAPPEIKAHPIAKEFYMQGITYNSMLDAVAYEGIPLVP